jgi:two-component system sensor histidine kinase VanS
MTDIRSSQRDPRRRARGLSVRLQLTLSYAAFVVVVGAAFAVVGFLVLRFVPEGSLYVFEDGGVAPSRTDLLKVFVRYVALALLVLSALGLGGGWIMAGRMLKPLTRITDAAAAVRDGSLDHRVRMPGRQNELVELADTFDEMLDRLQEAFEVQERFAANASHELRTPLAVTSTMLEVASRAPDQQDYPKLLERLRVTNDRAIGLTESLLRLADANAVGAQSGPIALAELVETTIAENAEERNRRGVSFTTQLDPVSVVGDAELLGQLIANLVQNAIRHSGVAGHALLSTAFDPKRHAAVLRIESTGSTVDAETAARLVEPFLRGSGRLANGEKGYGLGLALVQRIAFVHEGSLSIVPREQGGLIVTVELPAGA